MSVTLFRSVFKYLQMVFVALFVVLSNITTPNARIKFLLKRYQLVRECRFQRQLATASCETAKNNVYKQKK